MSDGKDMTQGNDVGEGKAADDPVKDKFRYALERKNKRHTDAAAEQEANERGKIQHTHGPAGGKRTFRRKSG